MNYLKINKTELRFVLMLATTIPLASFVLGFCLGSFTPFSTSDTPPLVSKSQNEPDISTTHNSIDLPTQIDIAVNKSFDESIEAAQEQPMANLPNPAETVSELEPLTTVQDDLSNANQPILAEATTTTPSMATQAPKRYFIQAGKFTSFQNANKYRTVLMSKSLFSDILFEQTNKDNGFILVLAWYDSETEAKQNCLMLEKLYDVDLYVRNLAKDSSLQQQNIASL